MDTKKPMDRKNTTQVNQWDKFLDILRESEAAGEPFVPKKELIDRVRERYGDTFHEYRLSTYLWNIKTNSGINVLSVRDTTNKRKVLGYRMPLSDDLAPEIGS